ncbi:MAG: tetratricopeptide repeat protein, partial [Alphaproteobacteria bacterium]
LATDETTWGDNHLNVAAVVNNLGLYYRRRGKTQAAEPLFRRAVAIKEKHLMPGDASLALSQVNLAAALRALGREEDAQDLERRAGLPPPEPPEAEKPAEEDSPETGDGGDEPETLEDTETNGRPVPAG